MNKFLVVASSLVAAVYGEAEADPALLYGGYGYGLGHPYAYGAYAFGGKSAPCVNSANVAVPCAGAPLAYAGYPYAAGLYGKREAEAEPEAEADAAVLYGGYGYPYGAGLGYAGHHGLGYAGLGYSGLGYAGLGYAGLGYAGLGYAGLGVAGVEGHAGVAATNAALGHAVAATPFGLTHSSNVGVCTNYLGASVPCGRKKREAEAEADADAEAAVLYGGYGYPHALGYGGYGGYGYSGLGYAGLGYAGLGYAGLGHAYGGVHATNAALGHAVAYTPYGATHSANVGVCTNYLGAQVPC